RPQRTSEESSMQGSIYAYRPPHLFSGGRASPSGWTGETPVLHPPSAGGQEGDVSGGGAHFQDWAASVQTTLGGGGARTPLSALGCNSNLGKIGADAMAVRQVDGRPDGDAQVRRQVNRDVSGRSFQHRIRAIRAGDELG